MLNDPEQNMELKKDFNSAICVQKVDAPTKSSVLYNAAHKLRHMPGSDDKEGVYRIWNPKEESQSIDEAVKLEIREKQVK